VLFMSTACGCPQGGSCVRLMWTHVDRGRGQIPDFLVDVINGCPLERKVNVVRTGGN